MKIIVTLLITFSTFIVFSQETTLSKKNVNDIFSKNAKGTLFNWKRSYLKRNFWDDTWSEFESHLSDYNVWLIENNDSSYYNSDTLTLYNYKSAYFDLEIGKIIEWTFYKKNKVHITKFDSRTAVSTVGYCCNKLKLKQKKGNIFLSIYKDKELVSHFKVINLSTKRTDNSDAPFYYTLTLSRHK